MSRLGHLLCAWWHKSFFQQLFTDRLYHFIIIHCITIPVGQKFTYTKLTVPLNSLENSRKLCHSFRSFWSANWHHLIQLEVYLWMYFKPYLPTQWLFARHHGKIWRNQLSILSIQTIVCKYKYHGTTQPSYRSERRSVLSPRDERTLVKGENQSQNNSKGPCVDAGGNMYKSIYIHSKTSPIST